jgi:hypothetical protein
MPPARPEQRISGGGNSSSNDGSDGTPAEVQSLSKKEAVTAGGLKFPEAYMEIENLNEIPLWLAPCHFVAALFQFMQAVFIFAFSARVDLKWCLFTFYPNPDNDVHETDIYAVPKPEELTCYTITWYAGVFIMLSGLDHLFCVLPKFRARYEYYIERHQSPQRWFEYSLSCPLMRVHIAQVAGITDLYTLILTFALGHVAIYFPLVYEQLNAKNRADGYVQNRMPFFMGCFAHCASWAVVFAYFGKGMAMIDENLAFALVLTLFVLELTFPITFVLQWGKIGPFQDYLIGEFTFCLLSFTTKTFLAWATLIGANAYARRG